MCLRCNGGAVKNNLNQHAIQPNLKHMKRSKLVFENHKSKQLWIESGLYQRKGKALNNFQKALPAPQSDLAEQTLRDPYNFDFILKEAVEKAKRYD